MPIDDIIWLLAHTGVTSSGLKADAHGVGGNDPALVGAIPTAFVICNRAMMPATARLLIVVNELLRQRTVCMTNAMNPCSTVPISTATPSATKSARGLCRRRRRRTVPGIQPVRSVRVRRRAAEDRQLRHHRRASACAPWRARPPAMPMPPRCPRPALQPRRRRRAARCSGGYAGRRGRAAARTNRKLYTDDDPLDRAGLRDKVELLAGDRRLCPRQGSARAPGLGLACRRRGRRSRSSAPTASAIATSARWSGSTSRSWSDEDGRQETGSFGGGGRERL